MTDFGFKTADFGVGLIQSALRRMHGIARGVVFESLFARERLGSTGIGGGMKLVEIGKVLNLTRERVRQIQQEALIKLKRAMAARGGLILSGRRKPPHSLFTGRKMAPLPTHITSSGDVSCGARFG